jgi:hypothetical protein
VRMIALREPCAARYFLRALRRHAEEAGVALAVSGWQSRPWSSALFTGHRHRVFVSTSSTCSAWGPWLAALPEADLPIRRFYVADIAVTPVADGVEVEALVLDE